jgi:hypothetical protein
MDSRVGDASVNGVAPIALDRVSNQRIKDHIDECCGQKDAKGQEKPMEIPGHATGGEADDHNGHSPPLGEIFPHEEVG